MPADGEFRFLDVIKENCTAMYRNTIQSRCAKTGFANGLMCCGAGYFVGYLATQNTKKAINFFAVPGFLLAWTITSLTCSMDKLKQAKEEENR